MKENAFKDLNPEQLRVMRWRDTERPYSGKYWDHDEHGIYTCAACGGALFTSLAKFDAGNGHPTFTGPITKDAVTVLSGRGVPPGSEVTCSECGGHLGYTIDTVEDDAKETQYVINSAALGFIEAPEIDTEDDEEDATKKKQGARPQQAPILQTIVIVVVSLAVGALIGNAYGAYICQMISETALQTIVSTSTLPITDPATTTSTTIVAPAGTPRATTSAATAATPAPVGVPATTSPAAGGAPANDGTI